MNVLDIGPDASVTKRKLALHSPRDKSAKSQGNLESKDVLTRNWLGCIHFVFPFTIFDYILDVLWYVLEYTVRRFK